MKWNKFLFAMDDLVYEDIQYSIHLTCSLCWKIKYSISLYIWAPFKTSQNVYFDIPFFALWRLLNSIHATLIPTKKNSSKIERDILWWNTTIYCKFYTQFLCYNLCSKKRQFNVDICSGFTMNIYEIVSAPRITNYIVSGIIFTNYETGRNDFKTIR